MKNKIPLWLIFIFGLFLQNGKAKQLENIYPKKQFYLGINRGYYYRDLNSIKMFMGIEEASYNYTKPFKYHSYDMGFQMGYKIQLAAKKEYALYYTLGFMYAVQNIHGEKVVNQENQNVDFRNRTLNIQLSRFTFQFHKVMGHLSVFDLYWLKPTWRVGSAPYKRLEKLQNTSTGIHCGIGYQISPKLNADVTAFVPMLMAIGTYGYYKLNHVSLQLSLKL